MYTLYSIVIVFIIIYKCASLVTLNSLTFRQVYYILNKLAYSISHYLTLGIYFRDSINDKNKSNI